MNKPSLTTDSFCQDGANLLKPDETSDAIAQLALTDFKDALQEFLVFTERTTPQEYDEYENITINNPVLHFSNALIMALIEQKASELELYSHEGKIQSWLRGDGKRREHLQLSSSLYGVFGRYKWMANLSPENVVPQRGIIPIKHGNKHYNLFIECTPTDLGERINAKLYDLQAQKVSLSRLGISSKVEEEVQEALRDGGLFLINGLPGSGKTTTAFALLHRLKTERHIVATFEEHPTYTDDAFIQTYHSRHYTYNQLTEASLTQPKGGRPAQAVVESLIRQGVNVLFCGDLTDAETADVALTAVEQGIVTIACVTAPSAAAAVSYLLDVGTEATRLTAALSGMLFQLLVGKACPHCGEEASLDANRQRLLEKVFPARNNDSVDAMAALLSLITLRQNRGCDTCHKTGVLERTGLFVYQSLTEEIRTLLRSNTRLPLAQTDWAQAQMRTFESVVWEAFTEAGISLEEIHAVVRPVVAKARRVV